MNIQLEWIGRKRTQAQLGNSISYKAPLMIIVYHSFTNLFIKLVSNRSLTYNDKKGVYMKKHLNDFKQFAFKGNVIDLAVGVIIGGAFGKIVSSLVNDILMPILSSLTGRVNFTDLKIILKAATETETEVAILYGNFIQNTIDFLAIAISIYFIIKLITQFKRKEEIKEEVSAHQEDTLSVLKEIRDSLKK